MNTLLIPATLAVGMAAGLAIGITTAAKHEPTNREKALEHALTVVQQASRLPILFWSIWAEYVAREAAEAADFAREMAADEQRTERTRALRELDQLGVLPLRPPGHRGRRAEDIRVEVVDGDEHSTIEDASDDGGTPV